MTAALFRRTLFDEVGLLDEAFESHLEDVDFGLRCALLVLARVRAVSEWVWTQNPLVIS